MVHVKYDPHCIMQCGALNSYITTIVFNCSAVTQSNFLEIHNFLENNMAPGSLLEKQLVEINVCKHILIVTVRPIYMH